MIGSMMMCVSAVVLLVGVIAGIVMGVRHDFLLGPAHAHLNLIGGVLLFVVGLYYTIAPAVGETRLAQIQGVLHMVGGIVFPFGIAVTLLGGDDYRLVPILGSLIVLAAMILFAAVVIRAARSGARQPHLQPHPWHIEAQRFAPKSFRAQPEKT